MTTQMIITLAIVFGTFGTLLFTKTKAEVAFFVAMALFCITGVLDFEASFNGLDNSSVLTVGILYITIAGLKHSGALEWIVSHIMGQPRNHVRALLRLMLPVGLLSSAMSNTACTALFQDVVKVWSKRLGINPSKLLIPLAYAASLGGLMTLIGTPPNLIIADMYAERTGTMMNVLQPFPVAVLIFLTCIAIVILMRNFLPERAQSGDANEEMLQQSMQRTFDKRTYISIVILVAMLLISALNILPLTTCCLIAGIMMVVTRCCSSEQAYQEVDWRVIIIFAGSVCMGKAITACGLDGVITQFIESAVGNNPQLAVLLICGVACITTEFLSDTGCAALFFPIAYKTAMDLNLDPMVVMVALMMSVSSSYATPIATPPNTIVYASGGYHFSDFARIGILLKIASLLISVFVTPLIY